MGWTKKPQLPHEDLQVTNRMDLKSAHHATPNFDTLRRNARRSNLVGTSTTLRNCIFRFAKLSSFSLWATRLIYAPCSKHCFPWKLNRRRQFRDKKLSLYRFRFNVIHNKAQINILEIFLRCLFSPTDLELGTQTRLTIPIKWN